MRSQRNIGRAGVLVVAVLIGAAPVTAGLVGDVLMAAVPVARVAGTTGVPSVLAGRAACGACPEGADPPGRKVRGAVADVEGRSAGRGTSRVVDAVGHPGGAVPVAPPGAGVPAPGAGYAWPLLPAPAVLHAFGAPVNPYGPGRRGVDLAGVAGQPVLAARSGTVVFAGTVAGQGVVALDHDDGLRTTYEPLTPTVMAGQLVAAGAVLGLLVAGRRGCAQVCLHWGVRRDRLTYLDPLVLLRPWRVRLLPWTDPSAV